MKKLLFTLLAITALSCSSSDDNNPVAVAPNIQLQKMEVKFRNANVNTTEYTYENNHLSKSTVLDSDGTVVDSATYSYTNDQLMKKTYFDNSGIIINVETFVYKDNRIVSKKNSNSDETTLYVYNDLGQVIKHQALQDGTTSDIRDFEYDAAGNPIKCTILAYDTTIISYTFDNKKTVASLLYPEAVLKIAAYGTPGNNNVIKSDPGSNPSIYDHEYNAAGYPTKTIVKSSDGTVHQEITYFYSN